MSWLRIDVESRRACMCVESCSYACELLCHNPAQCVPNSMWKAQQSKNSCSRTSKKLSLSTAFFLDASLMARFRRRLKCRQPLGAQLFAQR
eukprot:4018783-Pleurochrysis_carterae.AAC.1